MNLKNFILTLTLLAGSVSGAWACGYDESLDYPNAGYSILPQRETSAEFDATVNDDETVNFWYKYAGQAVDRQAIRDFLSEKTPIASSRNPFALWLRKRNDTAAIGFFNKCRRFSELNTAYNESLWDYEPASQSTLTQFAASITVPASGALAERWLFLKMRALFAAGKYSEVENLWTSRCKALAPSPMRDRMEGYYAGALYRTERYVPAAEVYFRLGDNNSASWCLEKIAGLNDLEQMVAKYPKSMATLYVLQDYVNHLIPFHYYWLGESGASSDYEYELHREREAFLKFCDRVLTEGKVTELLDWEAARALVLAIEGKATEAHEAYMRALKMPGSRMASENLNRVKIYVDLVCSSTSPTAAADFIEELQRLVDGANAEMNHIQGDWDVRSYNCPQAYYLLGFLGPQAVYYFTSKDQCVKSAAMRGILENLHFGVNAQLRDYIADMMNIKSLENLDAALQGKSSDVMDNGLAALSHINPLLVTDATGMKLMLEGKYKEALRLFDSLPTSWIVTESVYPWLAGRTLGNTNPFGRKQLLEAATLPSKPRNVKSEYCRQVIDALDAVNNASTGDARARALLKAAQYIFQGSSGGDLWGVTAYSWSSADSRNDEMALQSARLLEQAFAEASDPALKGEIACGQILVTTQSSPAVESQFDWNDDKTYYYLASPSPAQKQALEYVRDNWSRMPYNIRSCDVMSDYVSGRFRSAPRHY